MNKEEIEQAKGHLGWLLDNGILTSEDEPHIENILKYIQQLELNVEASRMEHENDLYENIENMELSATKICVLQELTCVIEDIEEILNIIEGEKK